MNTAGKSTKAIIESLKLELPHDVVIDVDRQDFYAKRSWSDVIYWMKSFSRRPAEIRIRNVRQDQVPQVINTMLQAGYDHYPAERDDDIWEALFVLDVSTESGLQVNTESGLPGQIPGEFPDDG